MKMEQNQKAFLLKLEKNQDTKENQNQLSKIIKNISKEVIIDKNT